MCLRLFLFFFFETRTGAAGPRSVINYYFISDSAQVLPRAMLFSPRFADQSILLVGFRFILFCLPSLVHVIVPSRLIEVGGVSSSKALNCIRPVLLSFNREIVNNVGQLFKMFFCYHLTSSIISSSKSSVKFSKALTLILWFKGVFNDFSVFV